MPTKGIMHFGRYFHLQYQYSIPFAFPQCEKRLVPRDSHIHATNPGIKLSLFYNLSFTQVCVNLKMYVIH
jgi:hypothetical protein